MKNRVAAIALSAGLFISAELGGNMLSSDAFLWAAAPSHAYAIIALVGVDLAFITLLWGGVRNVGTLAVIVSMLQFLAMLGDLAGLQPPSGMTTSAFRSYLLSDNLYVALLAVQPAVASLGIWFRRSNYPSPTPSISMNQGRLPD